MTPDRAPTVQQLLAFYLEAGVDCALTEEPVNRLSDPDIVAGSQRSRRARSATASNGQDSLRPIPAARGEAGAGAGGCDRSRRGKRREPRLRSKCCARCWKISTAAR